MDKLSGTLVLASPLLLDPENYKKTLSRRSLFLIELHAFDTVKVWTAALAGSLEGGWIESALLWRNQIKWHAVERDGSACCGEPFAGCMQSAWSYKQAAARQATVDVRQGLQDQLDTSPELVCTKHQKIVTGAVVRSLEANAKLGSWMYGWLYGRLLQGPTSTVLVPVMLLRCAIASCVFNNAARFRESAQLRRSRGDQELKPPAHVRCALAC